MCCIFVMNLKGYFNSGVCFSGLTDFFKYKPKTTDFRYI